MAAKSAIEIRDVRAHKGQRRHGFLEIGESASGPIRIPLVIINGEEDGPVVCLTAGVHATEYPPIDAVMRAINGVDPGRLRGAVVAVPVANMAMFETRTPFVSPIDGLNLNKIAPGNRDGTISEILAQVLLDEVIGSAGYHIDLHGGDFGEMLLPFVAWSLTGDADRNRKGEALARIYGPELIVPSAEGSSVPPFQGAITHEAARRGVVSIFAEAGGNGTLEEGDVGIHVNGIHNVLRWLGMIDGELRVTGQRVQSTSRFVTRAKRSGLLRLKVRIGDPVAEGQELGEICNVFGETVEVVRSAHPGVAGLIWAHKVVTTGDPIVRCWVTEPAAPFPETDRLISRA